jgi:hypothetical protein
VPHGRQLRLHVEDARCELLVVDERRAAREVHHVDVVSIGKQHRERHAHGPDPGDRVLAGDVLHAVRHQERDAVPAGEAERRERIGQSCRVLAQLPIGHRAVALSECRAIPAEPHRSFVQVRYRLLDHGHPRRLPLPQPRMWNIIL